MTEADLVLSKKLEVMRLRLGLSLHAMAELLYTSQQTYRNWEAGSQPRREAQARIDRFLTSANDQLSRLYDDGISMVGLVPLTVASSTLGVPHETLFHAYREGKFGAHDLGILGIWVREEDIDEIMDAVLG